MSKDQIFELGVQANEKMNAGDLDGALEIARRIGNLGADYYVSYVVSGLLIDLGNIKANENIVREGLELLEKDFETIIRHKDLAPAAYYNRANGYYVLSHFRRMRDPYAGYFEKKTELDEAKFDYRKALEYNIQDANRKAEIWVNLGNCFDEIGRVVEALECYDEALKYKPDHGMALGNKGMALFHYADVTGKHERTFLLEAYSILSKAKSEVTTESVGTFSKYLKYIQELF